MQTKQCRYVNPLKTQPVFYLFPRTERLNGGQRSRPRDGCEELTCVQVKGKAKKKKLTGDEGENWTREMMKR